MPSTTLILLIFLVALVYASVGHGGASGYLAAMSLLAYAPARMASGALMLNLLVAGTAWLAFRRAGHASFRLLWPFLAGSVPAAFLGGWLQVSSKTYGWLLALVLLAAAIRLCLPLTQTAGAFKQPRRLVSLAVGAGIGVISGIVGVGGGIFLSPLMILLRWADPKQTAAASAGFIVVNSASGLIGRAIAGRLVVGPAAPLILAAFVGGLIGSQWGAGRCSGARLCRVLAAVLAVAAVKWIIPHG